MELRGTDPLNDYLDYLHGAYGDDFHRPDFSFINATATEQPHVALIEQLGAVAKVYELTNWNDDVAYSFRLEYPSKEKLILWLSVVGPFAMLHRGVYEPGPLQAVDLATERQPIACESEVVGLVTAAGFRFPRMADLVIPVDFDPPNDTGPVPLVRLLFSDNVDLWQDLPAMPPG